MWTFLFGQPRAAFEAGTLVFTNVAEPLMWWAGAALVSVIIWISVLTGRRTRGLAWWKQGALALLQIVVVLGVIGLLAGPGLELRTLEPGANHVAVLTDVSGSMGYPETDGGSDSRLAAATALGSEALLPALTPLGEVALFRFDTSAVRLAGTDGEALAALTPGAGETHLIRAVDTVLSSFQGMPLAAVVVLSDGADTESPGGAALAELAGHGIPVHSGRRRGAARGSARARSACRGRRRPAPPGRPTGWRPDPPGR